MESAGTLFGADVPCLGGGRSWSRRGRFLELTCPRPLGGCLERSRRGAGEGPEGRVPGAVAARSEGVPGTPPNMFGMRKTIRKLIGGTPPPLPRQSHPGNPPQQS